jgi:hypothetical protein
MNRRQLLGGLAAGVATGLAGCAALDGADGTAAALGRVEVINFSRVRNRVRVLVDRDGEDLLDETVELAPFDAGPDAATRILRPRWSPTPGRYTLQAMHYGADGDRETTGAEYTVTGEDYESFYGDGAADPGCVGAVVKVGSDASEPNATIGVSPTRVDDPCGGGGAR